MEVIASGLNADVARIDATSFVVKISKAGPHFHDSERDIFDQLGSHPYLVKYHGEVRVQTSDGPVLGLRLAFHPTSLIEAIQNHKPEGHIKRSDRSAAVTHIPLCCLSIDVEIRQRWLWQAVCGLAHLHAKGVIHADFGAKNILLSRDDTLKICDFGGSSLRGSQAYAYPSPRYRRSSSIAGPVKTDADICWQPTAVDDMFALGTVMYEILTWSELYKGLDAADILNRNDHRNFPSLGLICNQRLEEIILSCWNGGYMDATELHEDPICECLCKQKINTEVR